MKDLIVEKHIAINANPEKVRDALTNPEKTKKYFFNCKVISSWEIWSPITFKWRIFLIKKIEMKGKIVDIERGKMLKYSLKNASDESMTTSTVCDTLSFSNGITTVSITDNVWSGEGANTRYKRSQKGWDKILKGLKDVVENN